MAKIHAASTQQTSGPERATSGDSTIESSSNGNPTPESMLSSGVGLSLHSSDEKKSNPLSVIKLPAMSTFFIQPNNKVGSAAGQQLTDGVQSLQDYRHQPVAPMLPISTSRGSLQFPINANQGNTLTGLGGAGALLPTSNRKVRDSGSLLFMLAYLGFLAYIIWDGMQMKETDVNLVIHGHDSYGNICGRDNKPIRFVERSGKNYTDKPYTKYTLINSQFERYTMIADQVRGGELLYVKEQYKQPRNNSREVVELWSSQRRRPPVDRLILKTDQNDAKVRTRRALQARSFDLESMQRNRSYLNEMKSKLMYQYPPMHGYTSSLAPSTTTTSPTTTTTHIPRELKPIEGRARWPTANKSAASRAGLSNKTDLVSFDDQLGANESDRYEHMLITPTNTNYLLLPTNRRPGLDGSGVLNHNEVTSQLLYLTECVSSCPQQDHVELIFYRCMPNNWRFSLFPNAINVTRTFIDDILTDISHCYRELIYTFSLALVLSLGLLILLRFLASLIIWSCIVLLISLFLSLASYSWITYYHLVLDLNNNHIPPIDSMSMIYADKLASSDRWLIGSIFLTFLSFATIGMVIFMRKRILLVTMLFRESGKAIADMPLLLLQPLLTFAALAGVTLAWLVGLVCLQSMKTPVVDTSTGFVVFKAETLYKVMKWYHMFAFLWVSHFAIACQHYVIGASVSKWYFSPNRYQLLNSPIAASVSELILYYLGSVALGSFLVAIFKVIRIITRQIQFLVQHNCMSSSTGAHQVMGSTSSGTSNGSPSLTTTSSSCCGSLTYIWRLFIWFFDNVVMIINRDAYVEIAIHGHSFVAGARRAFTVLAQNPLRLIAIKSVSNILLVVAKICVVFGTISVAYVLLEEKSGQLNYSWSPIVISAIYAYIVAHWFLSVYEMVIDALFICYCEDYELSRQALSVQLTGSRFMSQILSNGQLF